MLTNTSVCSVPLTLKTATGTRIGTGTGFWFRRSPAEQLYLVTNWHVVTGRDPTEPSLSSNGAIPAIAEVTVHPRVGADPSGLPMIHHGVTRTISFVLNDEAGENPGWLEHRHARFRADVVAIPAAAVEAERPKLEFKAIGDAGVIDQAPFFEPAVTDDVFVIGYPWGLNGGGEALPIYKRGTIASEPLIPQAGLPRFLIDCRTASGLSGAPVIAMRQVFGDKVGPDRDARFGRVGAFVGVYSGRLRSRELKVTLGGDAGSVALASDEISEIGIVWQRRVLEEIVHDGVAGTKLSELT